MLLEQPCVDQKSIWNHLFQSNFDQKPWANYQAFFQFLPHIKKNILSIGLGFSFQKTKYVPTNKYDKKLDYVLTEGELLY